MVVYAERNEVFGLFATTIDTDVMLIHHTGTRYLFHPIGTLSDKIIDLRLGITLLIGTTQFIKDPVLLDHETFGIEELRHVFHCLESDRTGVRHFGFGLLTAFGCNEDDTSGSVRTVDRCCRRILEHVDRLDIIGGDIDQTVIFFCSAIPRSAGRCTGGHLRNTIDHDKRFLSGQTTTNDDVESRTRACGFGCNVHTGSTTAQHLTYRGGSGFGQFIGFDHFYRTGYITFLGCSVTDDHHFFECFGIGNQYDVHIGFCRYVLRSITYVRDDECLSDLGIDGEVTVEVGDRTHRCAFNQDTGTDNGFIILIQDQTRNIRKKGQRNHVQRTKDDI